MVRSLIHENGLVSVRDIAGKRGHKQFRSMPKKNQQATLTREIASPDSHTSHPQLLCRTRDNLFECAPSRRVRVFEKIKRD